MKDEIEIIRLLKSAPQLKMNPHARELVREELYKHLEDSHHRRRHWSKPVVGALATACGLAVALYIVLFQPYQAVHKRNLTPTNSHSIKVVSSITPETIQTRVQSDYSGPRVLGKDRVLRTAPFQVVVPKEVPGGYRYNGITLESIEVHSNSDPLSKNFTKSVKHVGQVTIAYFNQHSRQNFVIQEVPNFGIYYVPRSARHMLLDGYDIWLYYGNTNVPHVVLFKGTLHYEIWGNASVKTLQAMAIIIAEQNS